MTDVGELADLTHQQYNVILVQLQYFRLCLKNKGAARFVSVIFDHTRGVALMTRR
jgi:hypothetical protein